MSNTDDDLELRDTDEAPEDIMLDDSDLASSDDDFDTEIADEDGKPMLRKKVAALKARHALEDYFESKKISHELNYLMEELSEEGEATS